jgi:hypothetical protein
MSRTANPNRKPHPKDPTGFTNSYRFSSSLFHRIKEIAERDQRSLSGVVNTLVEEGLRGSDRDGYSLGSLETPLSQSIVTPSISARLPIALFNNIQGLALREARSLNFVVNRLVEKGLAVLHP